MAQKSRNTRVALALGVTLAGGLSLAAKPLPPHEHGAMTLHVAIDGTAIGMEGEMPGDDAFGFEHAPRNAKEKKIIKDAMKTLRERALEMFVLPADAGCTVTQAKVESPLEALADGKPAPKEAPKPKASGKAAEPEDHNDVDFDYRFSCTKAPSGGVLKLGLMKMFPRMRIVRVEVNGPSGQSGAEVKTADDAVKL